MITKTKLAAALSAAAMMLTACGGGSADEQSNETIRVGAIPVMDAAPLYVGLSQGFFEDEGLEIEPVMGTGFQASMAGALNGELTFGFAATIPILTAYAKGAPITMISQSSAIDHVSEAGGIVVREDSDVQSFADLEGKKVAVNALGAIQEIGIRAAIERADGDHRSVTFVEMPSTKMAPGVSGGQVAAAAMAEPFLSQATSQDMRSLGDYTRALPKGSPTAGWFASKQYAAENPELVERFRRAMAKSVDYAQANRGAVITSAQEFTDLTTGELERMELPIYSPDFDASALDELSSQLGELGVLRSDVDAKSLLSGADGADDE